MGGADGFPIINLVVAVVMTRRASGNCRGGELIFGALMLFMTYRAGYTGFLMSFRVRGVKLLGRVAADAGVFDRLIHRMAGRA